MEIKYPDGVKLFAGTSDGCVLELSILETEPVHDSGKILKDIISMDKTLANKS